MIPKNSVENYEDLTHAGGERFFGFLSSCDEPPIVVSDHGIEAGADESGHVQTASDVDAPAFDMAAATMLARIIGHGRDSDESRDLAPGECSQFRQLGDQHRGDLRPDTGNGLQQLVFLAASGRPAHVFIDVIFNIAELFLYCSEHALE